MAEELPTMPDTRGRRACPRLRVSLPAQLIALEGDFPAMVENISATGARIVSQTTARAGASCVVRVMGLELFADVAWSNGNRCGLAFEFPLTEQQLLQMRQLDGQHIIDERIAHQDWARNWVQGAMGRGS